MTAHRHRCGDCGDSWACIEPKPLARCPVTVAARVNGQGPFCGLCLHLMMAKRHAESRHLRLRFPRVPRVTEKHRR